MDEKANNLRAAILKATEVVRRLVAASRIPTGVPDGVGSRGLVAPLEDSNLCVRDHVPLVSSCKLGGFWSVLASAWNAPAATYLGDHHRNFRWGGGTAAIRN